jgi:hypothetical protein
MIPRLTHANYPYLRQLIDRGQRVKKVAFHPIIRCSELLSVIVPYLKDGSALRQASLVCKTGSAQVTRHQWIVCPDLLRLGQNVSPDNDERVVALIRYIDLGSSNLARSTIIHTATARFKGSCYEP